MKVAKLLLTALLAALLFSVGYLGLAVKAADDLQILVGEKKQTVDSRENQGRRFFELKDIVEILKLDFDEDDGKATVSGARGKLELTGNRPLIRFKDEYILLDQPVWRRKQNNWYVSEDFLQKALPLILTEKLERQAPLQYRLRPMDENRVQVEVTNFPDHVRVVFTPSQKSAVRVQELQDSILVSFGDYLVVPRLPRTKPDPRIVDSVQFVPTDVYGAFSIRKGSGYYNFREYSVDQPPRRVIDLYAPPVTARAPLAEPVAPPPEPVPDIAPAPPPTPEIPVFKPHSFANVVTIDPGHGGEDYGAHLTEEDLEKTYTLRIAQRIEERLRGSGYRGVLTRNYDTAVTLDQRSALANYYQSECYVSVHVGGAPSKETHGPVVYVCSAGRGTEEAGSAPSANKPGLTRWDLGQKQVGGQSRRLAELVQRELNAVFGTENHVVEVPLAPLQSVTAPAILVEAGFLTHPEDQRKLASQEFQGQIAAAVVKAIQSFLR